MNVTVLEDALADLADGYGFYERQSGGLGTYFLDSLWSDNQRGHGTRRSVAPLTCVVRQK